MIEVKSKDGKLIRCKLDEFDYNGQFMGERTVSATVKSWRVISFEVGDYIEYRDEVFIMDFPSSDTKNATPESHGEAIIYELSFKPTSTELDNCQFQDYVLFDNGLHYSPSPKFTFIGTAKDFADRIKANLDRVYPGAWSIEVSPSVVLEDKNIEIDNTSCWNAVVILNKEFLLNFSVVGRNIKIGFSESILDHTFYYGKNNGLYNIERVVVDDNALITRLIPYGSERNIPAGYNKGENDIVSKKNLMLPGYLQTGMNYIDSENVAKYGIREFSVLFDDIYPSIEGVTVEGLGRIDEIVSADKVSLENEKEPTFKVQIKDIGFNIADHLTPETAVISIKNGSLIGYEFEISKVEKNASGYELTLKKSDRDNWIVPNPDQNLSAEDRFVLLNIRMPEKYVSYAEGKLFTRAKSYIGLYDHSQYTYNIGVDDIYMARNYELYYSIREGNKLRLYDSDLNIDRDIIIQSLSIKEGGGLPAYSITLSDTPTSSTIDKIWDAIGNIKNSGSIISSVSAGGDGSSEDLNKKYLRKDVSDIGFGFYTWEAGFMTKSTIRSAEYNIGWEAETPTGWSVSETGTAWYTSLNVRGPILSNNIIGSPYYASGWTGFGSQWDLSKHRLETDFVSVRKELRVYALDVFRIYGTNGDLAVSTTNKIDRVEDMGTVWRCHIDDYDGEMYMNMRIDDIVKCQTWEKKSGRYYMARVTNINNTWFELSKILLEGETTPAKGDVLIRWDNLTNADRKGLLYLSASDSYAPYMDVRYGDWNATFGTIKVRNGRLDGINDPAFPELYGAQNNFGLYTCNFYGTGELILRSTGESVSRTFEVLKDSIKMGLDEVRYEIQVSQDSILSNPIFKDDTTGWEIANVIYPWTINGGLLAASGNPFVNFISGGVRVIDPVNDRTVLQVTDSTVTQRNAIFTDRKPGKYALRFAYRSLLGFGRMEVGVSGSNLRISVPLSENQEYQKAEIISEWDGTGDFIIKVTGGTVNITDISFTSDKLANAINEIKVYYDTKLTFYAEKAVMNSFREEYDKFNQVVKKDYATQTWTYNAINTEVGTIVNGKLTNYSTTSQTSTLINNKVADLNMWQYATTSWTSTQITNSVSNKASVSYVDQTADALSIRIQGTESITDAFYKFDSTRMMTNRRIEIGSGGGTGFVASAGFAPSSIGPAFWCGSTFANRENASIKLSHDGSGWLAKKNINWDTSGNAKYNGEVSFVSGSTGLRIRANEGIDGSILCYDDRNSSMRETGFFNATTLRFGSPTSAAGYRVKAFEVRPAYKDRSRYTIRCAWPSFDQAEYGDTYKDTNGFLKVK